MRDTVLDWDDALPERELDGATRAAEAAGISLCVGTSLRMLPAAELPLLSRKLVIINLQVTPYDDSAALVIRARCDDVFRELLPRLGVSVKGVDPFA
jgi:mono-ADP-ribosyltransferase sirtuin 6